MLVRLRMVAEGLGKVGMVVGSLRLSAFCLKISPSSKVDGRRRDRFLLYVYDFVDK